MPSPLDRLYVGCLAALTPPEVATPPADALPAVALLDPGCLDRVLTGFAAQYGAGDRRAVASLWSKWHFSALLAPGLAANLLLERDLPLGLPDLHLGLAPDGHTARLWLAHEGRPLASLDAAERFATLIEHLAPLIAALADFSGAAPRVFWSNAGNYFEYFARALAEHPMALPGTSDEALDLLERRHTPDGARNPLYRPVRYLEAGQDTPCRMRRLCCLRYLLPELELCGNCPLTRRGDAPRAAQ